MTGSEVAVVVDVSVLPAPAGIQEHATGAGRFRVTRPGLISASNGRIGSTPTARVR